MPQNETPLPNTFTGNTTAANSSITAANSLTNGDSTAFVRTETSASTATSANTEISENTAASASQCSDSSQSLLVGIDIGSTTGKIAVYDPHTEKVIFRRYARHHAKQVECVKNLFVQVKEEFPNTPLRAAFCGSGGAALAGALGLPYVQEVMVYGKPIKNNDFLVSAKIVYNDYTTYST